MFWAITFAAISIFYRFTSSNDLSEKSTNLKRTISYSLNRLDASDILKDEYPWWSTLSDIIDFSSKLDADIKNSTDYRLALSIPYDNFLKYFYTPSLNIWKNQFTEEIDTDLLGKRYIEENPYSDITLITKWTSFFKDVGMGNSFNTISDIKIGVIEQATQPGYFTIPVSLSFETPDKRSFLLLVNKISMTAYVQNISLINEFIYNLRKNIKTSKGDIILQEQKDFNEKNKTEMTEDQIIWLLMYNWIANNDNNILIDQKIIDASIEATAGCIGIDREHCLYLFREKMRSIPYLAYGIGRLQTDQIEGLKFFFTNLPPIISISDFSFSKKDLRLRRNANDTWYKGTITIKVYGRDVTNEEVDQISNKLWSMCFNSEDPLTLGTSRLKISSAIDNLGARNVDTKRSQLLNQALNFVNGFDSEYDGFTNYKKAIKLFESYRTLKENNICDKVVKQEVLDNTQDNIVADEWIIDESAKNNEELWEPDASENSQLQTGDNQGSWSIDNQGSWSIEEQNEWAWTGSNQQEEILSPVWQTGDTTVFTGNQWTGALGTNDAQITTGA